MSETVAFSQNGQAEHLAMMEAFVVGLEGRTLSKTEILRALKFKNDQGPHPMGPEELANFTAQVLQRRPGEAPAVVTDAVRAVVDQIRAGGDVTPPPAAPEPSRGKNFVPQAIPDLLAEPDEPMTCLIDGFWPEGQGFVAGPPGAGKTWLALSMGIAVATGLPFLGKFNVPHPGPVLLISEEGSRRALKKRLRLLLLGLGFGPDRLKDFHHITKAGVAIPRDVASITETVKTLGARLVIFDAMRRFHGYEENSSTEMQPVLQAFAKIRTDTGTNVLLVHHTGKPNEKSERDPFSTLRGTSDFWGWRDTIVLLQPTGDETSPRVLLQFRDEEAGAGFQIVRKITPEMATLAFAEDGDLSDLCDEILTLLKIEGALSGNRIAQALKKKRATVGLGIKKLLSEKKIVSQPDGKLSLAFPDSSETMGNGVRGVLQ